MLRKIGSFLGSALKKVGDVGTVVAKVANSPIARTIATAVGTVGRVLAPEISAVNPAIGSAVNSVSKGLQSGSILNKVSNIASMANKASQLAT
jgi:hypothetical protein